MRSVRSEWRGSVIICGKCSGKLDGGFGSRRTTSLAKALRGYLGLKKGRKAALGIVETKCLGLCPKNAVVMIDAARPDAWSIVPAGAPIDDVAATLSSAGQPA